MPLPFESQLPPIAVHRPASATTPRNASRPLSAKGICLRDGSIKHKIRAWVHKGSWHGLQEHGQQARHGRHRPQREETRRNEASH